MPTRQVIAETGAQGLCERDGQLAAWLVGGKGRGLELGLESTFTAGVGKGVGCRDLGGDGVDIGYHVGDNGGGAKG